MMTIQQMRDIPIGGKVWYYRVTMCEKPSIMLYVDRPCVITKVEDFSERRVFPCFYTTGMPMWNYPISYEYDGKYLFLDEKSAMEYYYEEIQKATKEFVKRKCEYCKNVNAYVKKIQDDAINQMNDFLNRGDTGAV